MSVPGTRLHQWATWCCDPAHVARVVEPALADLQKEHADAVERGLRWRASRVRLEGTLTIARLMFGHAFARAFHDLGEWTSEDRRAAIRATAIGVMATAIGTALFTAPIVLWGRQFHVASAWELVPAATPAGAASALPFALAVAIYASVAGRPVSRRVRVALMAVAAVSALTYFVAVDRVVPASNQAFREQAIGYPPQPGLGELTRGELAAGASMTSVHPERGQPSPRTLWFTYHMRSAAAAGVFVLALLALRLARRRSFVRIALLVSVALAYWTSLALLLSLSLSADQGPGAGVAQLVFAAGPTALAWMPNALVGLMLIVLGLVDAARGITRRPAVDSHASRLV